MNFVHGFVNGLGFLNTEAAGQVAVCFGFGAALFSLFIFALKEFLG